MNTTQQPDKEEAKLLDRVHLSPIAIRAIQNPISDQRDTLKIA